MSKVKKAIIPAAGLGTRFLPATKAMPKEMLPIVDKPTIQYIVEEAISNYQLKGKCYQCLQNITLRRIFIKMIH